MDTDDLPDSVDLKYLTSITPELILGCVPGLERIYDENSRSFVDEGDGKLPTCYTPRFKGKARALVPSHSRHDDIEYDEDDLYEEEMAAGDANSDIEMLSDTNELQRLYNQDLANIEKSWMRSVNLAHAAPITIVNEIDDEPFPLTTKNFRYREASWEYGPGTCKPKDVEAFLFGCTCEDNCMDPDKCDCQRDDNGNPAPMYKQGKFLFKNEGYEVTECNKNCPCNKDCPNKVAQRPRNTPIQIFKTESNGWGARVLTAVKKGTVLGMYTGRVVLDKTRNSTEVLMTAAETDGYESEEYDEKFSFDLDTRNHQENVDALKFYSVVSERTGNWTRFVNHSCDPSVTTYPVLFDTPIESNCPHLVFVASRNIATNGEITLDYNPGNSGSKRKAKKGNVKCLCNSQNCRRRI